MHMEFIKYGTPITRLIEECAEVIHALCKAERFGLDDHNPNTLITNRQNIKSEIEDLSIAIVNFHEWELLIPVGSDKKRIEENKPEGA